MPTLEDPSLKGNQTSSSGYSEPLTGSESSLDDRDYLERQNKLTQPGSPEGIADQEQYNTSQSSQFSNPNNPPKSTYLRDQADKSRANPHSQIVGGGNTGLKKRLLGENNEKLLGAAENTKAGQAISRATETYDKAKKKYSDIKNTYSDVKSVGKLLATGGTDIGSWLSLAKEHALPLLKKHWPVLVALILVAEMPFILIAIAIATSLGSLGNPAGGVAVAANTQYSNTRCSEMQSTLAWKMPDGKGVQLSLFATEGEFSKEKSYDYEALTGGAPSFNSEINKTDPKSPYYFPDAWKPYYASGRFVYGSSKFHYKGLNTDKTLFPGLPEKKGYAARRLIFYNPANGKSAVAIAMDWGPDPAQTDTNKAHTTQDAEEQLWNGPGSKDGYRINNPPGDKYSLVGGASDAVANAIGAEEFTQVEMGFATDQTLDPTKPFKCTPVQSTVSAPVASGQLPADKGICSFCKQMPLPADSPNINHNYGQPKAIVLHYLATPQMDAQKAWTYFNGTMAIDNNKQKYVQFVVNHDGTITQFLPETKQAAGALYYNKANGGVTISIENEGHFENDIPSDNFTSQQVAANTKLVKYLQDKYQIPSSDVISHFIADCRAINLGLTKVFHKSDPGMPFMHAVLGQLGVDNSSEEKQCTALKHSR